IDFRNVDVTEHRWGEVNPAFGEAAVHYTREAGRLALAGEIDAMVSAPLNKEAMHAAGHRYEGQTEILGELTGSRPAMLLLLGKMRLMLFTNHMALRAVCDYVRQDRVLDRLALADAALRDLGIARPPIRPSTGHGTAFDIAGKNVADHRNLLEAIRVAAEIAVARRGAAEPGLAAAYGRAV